MKFTISFLIGFVLFGTLCHAQTFNGAGGSIPDSGSVQGTFPIAVSGIGNINNNMGVVTVCININHPWVSDLEIYLLAPDGTSVPLSIQNGGSGDDYIGTCFSGTALTPVADAAAPFTGNYIPDGYIGAVNNGQNADGIWNLYIKDVSSGQTGTLLIWSINFSTNLPAAPPVCNGNLPPANTCANATSICSFYGYYSATSSSYTADSWPEFDNLFCGTVQNNAFVKFVATGTYMNFSVWVTSSTNHDGIQMQFFDGGCGSGAVTDYGCYSPIRPGSSPNVITASGLTPGNIYYLMIDGYAGDECNYIIEPFPAEGGLTVTAESPDVCLGKSIQLNATGGNGIYSWSGAGLDTYSGNLVHASPLINTIYNVSSIDPGGLCPVIKSVSIVVLPLPASPTVTGSLSYCNGSMAAPLTATGLNLLWYSTSTGGIGSPEAIIPTTLNPGTNTYYVTQTIVCESQRTPITVIVKEAPSLGPDKQKNVCMGNFANLSNEFNITGLNPRWTFNGRPINSRVMVNSPGTYQVEVTNLNGCSDTAIIHFAFQPSIHVFAGDDTIAVKGLPHQLHCSPAATYSWWPENLLNNAHIQNPTAILTSDQQFVVNVTDLAGCKGSDSIIVKVIQGITYYVPNAFTPNGDGLNDVFRAVPAGIVNTEFFRVANRFGQIIFESSDPFNKGWNGTSRGCKQAPGSYVWFIKGKDIHGKNVELKGTVLLIL